jgi:RHH-type proline utilization regulon transcriptional repressor/proline dehydrogenase/delta 1-pyrroline-5-carboxylate dehydrogenase
LDLRGVYYADMLRERTAAPTPRPLDEPALEQRIQTLGAEILEEARGASASALDAEFYTGKLIEWAMRDAEFRVSLFRFVDVLPALRSPAEIVRHVQEYFQPLADRIPALMKWGLEIDPESLTARATAALARRQVRALAGRFILGESPRAALKSLRAIRAAGMAFTVDLLGEAVVSETEAEQYRQRYLDLIDTLRAEAADWPQSRPLIAGHPGEASPLNISVKLSALYSQASALNTDRTIAVCAGRLADIVRAARRCGCFVYVDIEHSQFTSITLETCRRVFGSDEFRDYDRLGFVLQSYLRRTADDLEELLAWCRQRGAPVGVRLVKGAYWDTETAMARLENWPIPVWQQKAITDAQYETLSRRLLDHHDLVRPAFGSHNVRSLCHAIAYAEAAGLDRTAFELQMLYGMGEALKPPFVKRGWLLRQYAPVGELIPGMGYLVRRLLENTSNQGFIRRRFHQREDPRQLLAKPQPDRPDTGREHLVFDPRREFRNWPARDFSIAANRRAIAEAIVAARETLRARPVEVRPIVAGAELQAGQVCDGVSPEDTAFVLARVGMASVAQADRALESLREFFPAWRDTPVEQRAGVLFKTAELLEQRRAGLTALIVLETGKPWADADADVVEAIDFLNYYALQAIALLQPRQPVRLAGEDNLHLCEPRGVCAVISPWNFPLSIPCGMVSAALVTGNCVALKPAEQSPLTAWHLFGALRDAGLPDGVAAFLPGDGPSVGARLVASPLVATIAFTGSKEVGLGIIAAAAGVAPGQEHVKRVIAEMGSKNAVIVDADADLDQAVAGVVGSAFGYAGQKCSAASRVIVLAPVYERFLRRLAAATESLIVGPATDPSTRVGPVIDEQARQRLSAAIADGERACRLVARAPLPADARRGRYVPPVVFAEVPAAHPLLTRELFGPVVAVVAAADFDAALCEAMNTEYGLTGALFSRSPRHLQRAAREFRVGNLYLNRGCTGARVHRQPFGGARMSGVGSQAGGPDYLRQFVIPRVICESTFRKGFAPMED